MTNPERAQPTEAEAMRRAHIYLEKKAWLDQADEEAIDTWRQNVSEKLVAVTTLLKDVDPFFDLSSLKEVYYKAPHPEAEAEDVTMISRSSLMLWKLPGTLCTVDDCYIGMDDYLYVAERDNEHRRQNPQLFRKPFFDMLHKDVVFLEDSLKQVLGAFVEQDEGVSFYNLFKKK